MRALGLVGLAGAYQDGAKEAAQGCATGATWVG
jgi:hypothetical protein